MWWPCDDNGLTIVVNALLFPKELDAGLSVSFGIISRSSCVDDLCHHCRKRAHIPPLFDEFEEMRVVGTITIMIASDVESDAHDGTG